MEKHEYNEYMEGKVVEKPRVPYSEIFHTIDGHIEMSYEDRIQVKAIDIMVDALLNEANLDDDFSGFTLGNQSRLKDKRDPNYGKDLLMSVHTPQQFYNMVLGRAVSIKFDENGQVVDRGFLENWESKMSQIAVESPGDLQDDKEAKELVRTTLENNRSSERRPTTGEPVLV